MNQADAQYIQETLEKNGYTRVSDLKTAYIIVLNTCTVRETTQDKMIGRLLHLEKNRDPSSKLIITGCLPAAQASLVQKFSSKATLIVPSMYSHFETIVMGSASDKNVSKTPMVPITQKRSANSISGVVDGIVYTLPIAEGCQGDCTYCIVKRARGQLVSFPPAIILSKLEEAILHGARELRITAQDTGVYGRDFTSETVPIDLPTLLSQIANLPGAFWVRVGMMNPDAAITFLDPLINSMKANKLFKFLHLPLQSGSNEILRKMQRKYSISEFKKVVSSFRKNFPESTLATDIIVGFPGETDEDFHETCTILSDIAPEKVHVARYSPRPGTIAAKAPQIPMTISRHRTQVLTKIRLSIAQNLNQQRIGHMLPVLITGRTAKGQILGRTHSYRPVIVTPTIEGTPVSFSQVLGHFFQVEIFDAGLVDLRGRILEKLEFESISNHL